MTGIILHIPKCGASVANLKLESINKGTTCPWVRSVKGLSMSVGSHLIMFSECFILDFASVVCTHMLDFKYPEKLHNLIISHFQQCFDHLWNFFALIQKKNALALQECLLCVYCCMDRCMLKTQHITPHCLSLAVLLWGIQVSQIQQFDYRYIDSFLLRK